MRPKLILPLVSALAVLLLSSRLPAQVVTVGDPVWLLNTPAPASLAAVTEGLRPSFPKEMRDTGHIGYATVVRDVTADGHSLQMGIQGTESAYEDAVKINGHSLDNLFSWNPDIFDNFWKLRNATVDGRPVETFVWVPVIFNPASAPVSGPDATPRLLAVTPVYVSSKYLHADGTTTLAHVRIGLDASGAVTSVTPLVPDSETFYWPTIQKAVTAWRFAPARHAGQPVAANVDLAVIPQAYFRIAADTDRMPQLLKSVPAVYPEKLEYLRLRAKVTIRFVIDTEGNVVNPVVAQSTNPSFNENALLAIMQWKFSPAIHHGQPVRAGMSIPVIFEITGQDYTNGMSAYSTGDDSAGSGPRENGPPIVNNVVDPVYPYGLLRARVSGSASERMVVDPRGRVIFVEILAASDPQFGLALAAALEHFSFDPAVRDGVPGYARVTYEHRFVKRDVDDTDDGAALDTEENSPGSIRNPGQLDQPLKAISQSAPIYPAARRASGLPGHAVVEFLVNQRGHVCLPLIVTASAPEFGYAAAQAVSVWLYAPPLAGGKPVVVRVRIPFNFKPTRPRA